jgi:hypothetical protein
MKGTFLRNNLKTISRQMSSASLLDVSAVIARELWWMNQKSLELKWGRARDQKWSPCGPPHNSNSHNTVILYLNVMINLRLALPGKGTDHGQRFDTVLNIVLHYSISDAHPALAPNVKAAVA